MNEKAIEFVKPMIALNEWAMWILIWIFLGMAILSTICLVLYKIYEISGYNNWDIFAGAGYIISAALFAAILIIKIVTLSMKKFPEAHYNEKVRFNEKREEVAK